MYARNRGAATVLLGLLVLSGGSVLAKDAQPTAPTDASRTPSLTEIAKANDAAWEAIKSVDMVYGITSQIVNNGKKGREVRSTDIHWSKEENRERLRGCFQRAELKFDDFCPADNSEYEDYFLDGKTARYLWDSDPKNNDKGELSCQNQKGLHGEVRSEMPRMLADHERAPQLLRYRRWKIQSPSGSVTNGPSLTLSEIINSDKWKVSLKGKETTSAGDNLWLVHAVYLPKDGKDTLAGSYMDIYVNADKNFLMQKVSSYATNVATKAGQRIGIYFTEEVKEFQNCGHGIYFPRRVEYRLIGTADQITSENGLYVTQVATKLSVNSPLPADTFDFRFPENMVVQQLSPENGPVRFLLWGPDNKPAKEFDTGREVNQYAEKEELELLRQRVEKNRSSTKPSDLVERGVYHLQTKRYEAAITAFSEALSSDPKPDDALFFRGMAYLSSNKDFAKAIADFTECLHHAPESENVAMCHYLRGLAYANEESTLDKAVTDMTDALRLDPNIQECLAGAYLVRSIAQSRKGNLSEAVTDATKAVEVDPENADAHAVLCYVYEKIGDQVRAKACRKASKRLRANTRNSNAVEAAFAGALHNCLARLLPALE